MLTPPAHVHWAACGPATTAVLNLRGDWTVLDGDGHHIWHTLTTHGDLNALVQDIASRAGTTPEQAQIAVTAYLEHLRTLGLLKPNPSSRRRWWRRRR
ncbi:PqqD family protein [Streptomyces uncialis]|uniref:PqqD family protein n=1 Tax=Streptomyces uncialis TaxID=1048205 RepID=UPI00364CA17B